MSNINDGGPAYPSMRDTHMWPEFEHVPGMSLRDYFAAMAMQGLIASKDAGDRVEDIPKYAYKIADAMLKAKGQS